MVVGPRVVVDTNVLFEGLTRQGGAAGLIVESWLGGLLDVCVSNAVAYEYTAVLSRNLSDQRWATVEPVLGALLARARYVGIYYSWRPTSPDPGDDHVIDCAMNAGAVVVTSNRKDFRLARETLGLNVLSPQEFVTYLAE
jgi:predicted nucleic acid-binding protein